MIINTDEFPFIRLDNEDQTMSMDEALTVFQSLLDRNEAFVFMSESDLQAEIERDQDVSERKKMSLWMKANRADIGRLVKGHIHFEQNAANQAYAINFAKTSEQFWGYPMFIVKDHNEAKIKALALLS